MKNAPRLVSLLLLAVALACSSGESDEAEARLEIEAMLGEYLPVLAEAYRKDDPLRLSEWVAEKEVARVHTRIEELAAQGISIQPTFHTVTVEDVKVWGNSNAFVTTLEVWDLKSVVLGTEMIVQEVDNQVNRVRYQLKKDRGRWRILFRTIAE